MTQSRDIERGQNDLVSVPDRAESSSADAPIDGRDLGSVDLKASRIGFVYPFTFDGDTLLEHSRAVERATWSGGRNPLKVWQPQGFPTADLLSHVADFLEPARGTERNAGLWRVTEDALRSTAGLGGGARHPGAEWSLLTRHGEIPFVIASVELALFRHGIGFLTIGAAPTSSNSDAWFDFVHHFRFVAGQRAPEVRAIRRTGANAGGGAAEQSPFFPAMAGGAGKSADESEHRQFGEVIDGLLLTAAHAKPAWWEEIFVPGTLLPYVSLFIDGIGEERIPETLYRLRNFFHSRQELHPALEDLSPDQESALPYALNQWFLFSLNGGGFLACDAPGSSFFRAVLPAHVMEQYFLLFLLALEQRFVLMLLSQRVARQWVGRGGGSSENDKAEAFAHTRDALLGFTAQGYFAQTMQAEHHHRCYVRWQQAFQLARLYEEVSVEVREMYQYLDLRQRVSHQRVVEHQEQQSKRVERRLSLVGWLLGVPVWLFLLVNSTASVAVVRHLLLGPEGVQGYDPLIALSIDLAGLAIALLAYRLLSRPSADDPPPR